MAKRPTKNEVFQGAPSATGVPALIGVTKDVYIAYRTDGLSGSGVELDPLDGSTQAKFDAIFTAYQSFTNIHFHLGPASLSAPFQTDVATKTWFVKNGWRIKGAGMYQTIVQMVGNMAGQDYGHSAFTANSNFSTDNVTISDLSIDNNSSILSASADTGSGGEKNYKTASINFYGSNNLVERVRSINSYGSLANLQESFDIAISSPTGITSSGNIIRFCIAESPLGNYGSPFAIFGDSAIHLMTGSSVYGCKAYGVNNGLNSGFTTGGVNAAWVKNCQVYDNYFEDCGSIYYQDTGTAEKIRVFGNTVIRARIGVGFLADGPSHVWTKQDIEISNNYIVAQNRIVAGGVYGILVDNATTTNIVVRNNIVKYQNDGVGLDQGWNLQCQALVNAIIFNNICDDINALCTGTGVLLNLNRTPSGGFLSGGVNGTSMLDNGPIFVNLNTGTPTPVFTTGLLFQFTGADSTNAVGVIDSFAAGATFIGRRANGTAASKTAVTTGDLLGIFGGRGFQSGGSYVATARALYRTVAAEPWTSSAQGAYNDFQTTPLGSTTPASVARIQPSGGASFGTQAVALTDPGNGVILVGKATRIIAVTFANAVATPVEGTIQPFTDSTTGTPGATITGGGSIHVLGYYNGTNWTVVGA